MPGQYVAVVTIRHPCNGDDDLPTAGFPVMGTTNGGNIFLWTRPLAGSDALNGPFTQRTPDPGLQPNNGAWIRPSLALAAGDYYLRASIGKNAAGTGPGPAYHEIQISVT